MGALSPIRVKMPWQDPNSSVRLQEKTAARVTQEAIMNALGASFHIQADKQGNIILQPRDSPQSRESNHNKNIFPLNITTKTNKAESLKSAN